MFVQKFRNSISYKVFRSGLIHIQDCHPTAEPAVETLQVIVGLGSQEVEDYHPDPPYPGACVHLCVCIEICVCVCVCVHARMCPGVRVPEDTGARPLHPFPP